MVEANQGKNPAATGTAKDMDMEEEKQVSSTTEHTDENQLSLLDGAKMRELTNLELIKKAEDCAETLKLEKAISLYDEGIRRFPNDTLILD